MIAGQKKVIDVCSQIIEKTNNCGIGESPRSSLNNLMREAQERELVVPVIGSFSSGKSSLINRLLDTNILPVAITPETSLATELHFSPSEFIEAVKSDGSTIRYEIDETKKMSSEAAQYTHARLYLHNNRLKEFEPIILVDMPGFDSPVADHNTAIMTYLERGCHYIVLSTIEDGTISKSLLRRLYEITESGHGFSFFISKTELRPAENVKEMANLCQITIKDYLSIDVTVHQLRKDSSNEAADSLKKLNVDSIFLNLYKNRLIDICQSIIEAFNIHIIASEKDADAIRSVIKEMQDSIVKLQNRAKDEADSLQQRYSGGIINDIINDVGKSLENAVEELISVAVTGNQGEITSRLNEIVRMSLIMSVKNKLGDVNQQIVIDFSESVKGLDEAMKSLEIDENYLSDLTQRIQNVFTGIESIPSGQMRKIEEKWTAGTNIVYKGITGILAVTTAIVNPVLEIVIIMLPEIIRFLSGIFGQSQQEQQKEMLRKKFMGEIFPNIKRKIRTELPAYLGQQIRQMIEQVHLQYEERIKDQRKEIDTVIEAKKANIAENDKRISVFKSTRGEIQAIANDIISWS
ncbi:MAG: dynamin family protein [Bacteroidales bacterium]|jgi:hypothetical protein|nr:dynamin family protein [Bacteroidales bacterium]